MRQSNLVPNCERSPNELREMGKKGGIKSGESRRKKRELQKVAGLILGVFDDIEGQGRSIKDALVTLEKNLKR